MSSQPSEPSRELNGERQRLADSPGDRADWRLWGPYLAGRQWGTVREDYSADGDAWNAFGFDQAALRAYRWGEDGIAGLCDRLGFCNLAVALWNGADDRLKERLYGLTNGQGNHGEDAKEYWWHVDATPTHAYAEYLYRYPQRAFPYAALIAGNAARSRAEGEYELADTGVLADDRFFDVTVRHVKVTATDMIITITATNQGPEAAPLDLLPQLWFRNTWSWGRDDRHPLITDVTEPGGPATLRAEHGFLGTYFLTADPAGGEPEILLCDNETNAAELWGATESPAHPKNAIERAVVHGDRSLLADGSGTKAALRFHADAVEPGGSLQVRLRWRKDSPGGFHHADDVEATRRAEADAFYAEVTAGASAEDAATARRAFAGLLWTKQHYRYDVQEWLDGDPGQVTPPPQRREQGARNVGWEHLALADVISMPDEWEYPWFAAWDLAFHAVVFAHIDPAFAKQQLLLLCRAWAMAPDGQLPAYEWTFDDVNPPVHAWAAWQVFLIDGSRDLDFLERIAAKMVLNYGWWMNRKDAEGTDLFSGGFLGMDNIGVFDRSAPLPPGERLAQSDATSWMAFFDLSMLRICWELARHRRGWDELATTFLDHFLAIAEALETFGGAGISLWDEDDGFYYDAIVHADGSWERIRVRTLVGLLPLLAVARRPDWVITEVPDYRRRIDWLRRNRPELVDHVLHDAPGAALLSVVDPDRLRRLLARVLDPSEFWSGHGIRSVSAAYRDGVKVPVEGDAVPMRYVPGESGTGLFGGNSNWRGPVWMPINALLVDALRTYGEARDDTYPFPAGCDERASAGQIADALAEDLIGLFRAGPDGRRRGTPRDIGSGPLWDPHPVFSEYFHGDTGAGLGASHQTGWTALVAHLICQRAGTEQGRPTAPSM